MIDALYQYICKKLTKRRKARNLRRTSRMLKRIDRWIDRGEI